MGRGERLEIHFQYQRFNQSCLHNKAYIKPLSDGVWRASRSVNAFMCQEVDTPRPHRDRSSCAQDPSYVPLHLAVHLDILSKNKQNKALNSKQSVSLSSVSHNSKLPNLRRRQWEPLICSQVGQRYQRLAIGT